MQIQYISLGGKERPVCFSHALAYHYELTTGKSYLRDLDALFQEMVQVAAGANTDNVAVAAQNMSVVRLVDIIHAALTLGARQDRINVEFDQYQVADWLMSDRDAVGILASMLVDANIDPGAKQDEDEKKRMRTPTKMSLKTSKRPTAK